jgi:hypothetical protein
MNEIYQIKNFISKDTCQFIIDSFKPLAIETDNPLLTAFMGGSVILPDSVIKKQENGDILPTLPRNAEKISELTDEEYKNYKIAAELINKILTSKAKKMSEVFNRNIYPRFLNYVIVETGGGHESGYHDDVTTMDGTYRAPQGMDDQMWARMQEKWDTTKEDWMSCILYLNDDYEGGEIEFRQRGDETGESNIKIKPEAGQIVFFIGDRDTEHGVRKVYSGGRQTLISFFWDDSYQDKFLEVWDEFDGKHTKWTRKDGC